MLFENDKNFIDPEKRWFNDINFLLGLPVNWLKRFKLYDSLLKRDCNQGELNGPDYIFEDISNNKLIGFEIVSIKWNIHHSFNNLEMVKKFAKNKIFNLKSYDDRINEFKNVINCKSKKNYVKTDELYLGIVVNDTLIDYEYYFLELVLNKYIKDENINLSGVFIL